MADLTSDPSDPRLTHGVDSEPAPQAEAYLVLSEAERAKGYVRPVRTRYTHNKCGVATTMSSPLAETYARNPAFYGATYCVGCGMHLPVDEFLWDDGTPVGS
jgi:hypothetical protein